MWSRTGRRAPIVASTRLSASSPRANAESQSHGPLDCPLWPANARNNRKSRADLDFGNQSPDSSGDVSDDLGFVYKNDPELMNGYTPPINPDTLIPLSPSMGSMDYEPEAHVPHMICKLA